VAEDLFSIVITPTGKEEIREPVAVEVNESNTATQGLNNRIVVCLLAISVGEGDSRCRGHVFR